MSRKGLWMQGPWPPSAPGTESPDCWSLVPWPVARGTAEPSSDVDVLYDLLLGRRLGWEIEDLTDELSELFGRPVDLLSETALHERLRATVLAEAQPLYAA